MSEEVKDCPLDGLKAELTENIVSGDPGWTLDRHEVFVKCISCGCSGPRQHRKNLVEFTDHTVQEFRADPALRARVEDEYDAYVEQVKAAAIAAWNTRPAPPAASGEMGEAVDGGYRMFRAIVGAGGPDTIARHGVEKGGDKWAKEIRAGMLAVERRFHPERFDADFTKPDPATPPAADSVAADYSDELDRWWNSEETRRMFHTCHYSDRDMAGAAIAWYLRTYAAPQQAGGWEKAAIPKPQYAYVVGESVIVTGIPQAGFHEESDQYHNCDAMGCGQEHVLYRVPLSRQGDEK